MRRRRDIGSGVDVQAYRRVRDGFLDLQYRAQATRLGEEAGAAEGLANAELALAEPSDDGISKQLSDFWDAWSDLANAPDDTAARQALVEQASSLAEAFRTVDEQLALVGPRPLEEFDALTAPGGRVEQIADEIGQLNETIRKFVTAGDPPNDLLDRRDLLLDELSTARPGLRGGPRRRLAARDLRRARRPAAGRRHAGRCPPPRCRRPSGRLGALQAPRRPGGRIDAYRRELNAVAATMADAVNGVHSPAGVFSFTGGAAAEHARRSP